MRAEELHVITSHIAFWQAYEPSVKCDLSCCALRTARGLLLVDPIPLAPAALDELVDFGAPAAVVCTNGNHARAAAQFRERWSVPVWAHRDAVAALGIAVDREIGEGEMLLDEVCVAAVPGAGPGEIALHHTAGSLHLGDAIVHLPPLGFAMLPEKYCTDARELRASLGKLLRFNFELLTVAHGLPIVAKARHRFETLLA